VTDGVHPAFEKGVAETLDAVSHAGEPGDGSDWIVAEIDLLRLAVRTCGGVVEEANFSGTDTPGERAVLELICRQAEGAPLQDVAEHAVASAMETLLDRSLPPPVQGILTPLNAGDMFQRPMRLARDLWRVHQDATGATPEENTFERPFSEEWGALSTEEKSRRIGESLAAAVRVAGLPADHLELSRLDTFDRGFILFSDAVSQNDRPALLMQVERSVRSLLGERIEFFAEEAKDANRIRRL